MTKQEKLRYVINKLDLSTGEISKKLEMRSDTISNIKNPYKTRLKQYHIYAICSAYDIPKEIFENDKIKNTQEIDNILDLSKDTKKIFEMDNEIINRLLGTWYFYSYQSNGKDIWQTTTTIYDDLTTKDTNGNRGKLLIGKIQSTIIKETYSKYLSSTTFDNNRVTRKIFPFSRISKVNGRGDELLNFGVCSKIKLNDSEANYILGNPQKVQLQMDYEMLRRIY